MNTGKYAYLASRGQLPAIMGGLPGAPQVPALSPGMIPQFGKMGKGPLTVQGPLPPKGRGLLGAIDDVFGGPEMRNLSPEQQKAARRRGLLAFGAQMLTATDPRGNRAQGLSALGQGVMAGQQGYGQGIEQGLAQQQAARRSALYSQFQPQPNESAESRYNRVLGMFNAAFQQGDVEGMKFISQALNTMPKPGESDKDRLKPSDMLKERDGYYYAPDPTAPSGFVKTALRWDQNEGRVNLPVNWQTTQAADGSVVQVNPRTGETRAVMDAQGNPLMGPRRPLTDMENKNAGFYDQAAIATEGLSDPSFSAPQSPGSVIANGIPVIGNAFRSSTDQQRAQLGQQFINAILRRESGAAIPEEEYPKYERQYIPVYGDSPATLARKARARATAVAGLRRSAGRAFGASVPDGLDAMDADAEGN